MGSKPEVATSSSATNKVYIKNPLNQELMLEDGVGIIIRCLSTEVFCSVRETMGLKSREIHINCGKQMLLDASEEVIIQADAIIAKCGKLAVNCKLLSNESSLVVFHAHNHLKVVAPSIKASN